MIKVVSLFLIGMLVLAMFGRLRMPGRTRRKSNRPAIHAARKCPDCGVYLIGTSPHQCPKG